MDPVLSAWQTHDEAGGPYAILPDGCCDLIWKHTDHAAPEWLITDLLSRPEHHVAQANTRYRALRFHPGAKINRAALLSHTQNLDSFDDRLTDNIAEFVHMDDNLSDALAYLASGKPIPDIARQVGVSVRTLQRLVSKTTGRTPVFWSMLARVRQAARDLSTPLTLPEIACDHGFADQAHMTREFTRWFGVSPKQMRQNPTLLEQIGASGFG